MSLFFGGARGLVCGGLICQFRIAGFVTGPSQDTKRAELQQLEQEAKARRFRVFLMGLSTFVWDRLPKTGGFRLVSLNPEKGHPQTKHPYRNWTSLFCHRIRVREKIYRGTPFSMAMVSFGLPFCR